MGPIAQTLTDQQMQDVAAYYASAMRRYRLRRMHDVYVLQIGGAIAASECRARRARLQWLSWRRRRAAHRLSTRPRRPIRHLHAHQLALWKTGRRGGDPMDIMELIAKAMTDEQIDAVARYYAAVKPQAALQATARAPGTQSPATHAPPDAISRSETEGILGLPMRPNRQPPYLGGAPASGVAKTDTGNEGRE